MKKRLFNFLKDSAVKGFNTKLDSNIFFGIGIYIILFVFCFVFVLFCLCFVFLLKVKGYFCKCLPGTAGSHCDQITVSRCTSNTCAQNGRCISLSNLNYKCICNVGYTGEFCEAKIDYCASNPCSNDGVCRNSNGYKKFKCHCRKGYTGETCEVRRY